MKHKSVSWLAERQNKYHSQYILIIMHMIRALLCFVVWASLPISPIVVSISRLPLWKSHWFKPDTYVKQETWIHWELISTHNKNTAIYVVYRNCESFNTSVSVNVVIVTVGKNVMTKAILSNWTLCHTKLLWLYECKSTVVIHVIALCYYITWELYWSA